MSVPETRHARTTGTRRQYPDAYRKRILALSDERTWWLHRVYASWRDGYDLGRETGQREGYELAARHMAQAWQRAARPITRPRPHDELERLRWDGRGREHYGDTQPGDHAGGPVPAW